MADSDVYDKIRKLLALSRDTSSPVEAALAAERVQALLYKYKLDLADIEAVSQIVEVDRPFITEQWRQILAAVTARYNFVRVVAVTGAYFKFIGARQDVDVVLALYLFLSRTIARLAREGWRAHVDDLTDPILGRHPSLDEPGVEEAWRESFKMGAVEIIGSRLKKMREQQDRDAAFVAQAVVGPEKGALVRRVTALARAENDLDAYVTEKFGQLRPMENIGFNLRLDGFARGVLAGKQLPIGPEKRSLR